MPEATEPSFANSSRTTVETSAGPVKLPISYAHATCLMAIFRIDHAAAEATVSPWGLRAVRLPQARSVAVLSFADYPESTIGPYREVGLSVAAVPSDQDPRIASVLSLWRSRPGREALGYAILALPVTTALACAAGREIWGFPKSVTSIQARLDGAHFRGEVTDATSDTRLLRLAGRTGLAVPSPAIDLFLYSRIGATLLRTRFATRGMGWLCSPGSVRLEITPPPRQTGDVFGLLGAHMTRPAIVFRAASLHLCLHGGVAQEAPGQNTVRTS